MGHLFKCQIILNLTWAPSTHALARILLTNLTHEFKEQYTGSCFFGQICSIPPSLMGWPKFISTLFPKRHSRHRGISRTYFFSKTRNGRVKIAKLAFHHFSKNCWLLYQPLNRNHVLWYKISNKSIKNYRGNTIIKQI